MAGIGSYEKGKAFALKSGNKPSFKGMGSSPLKKHDGTTSSTTHYKDGSAKSKREVDFSKRHETEVNKSDGDYQKRHEELLNQGFTPEDADHMIKNKAVTGRVDRPDPTYEGTDEYRSIDQIRTDSEVGKKAREDKAKAEHPKYDKKTKKKKSPLKCPLLAALPMITQVAGAVGAVGGAAKAMKKDKE